MMKLHIFISFKLLKLDVTKVECETQL